MNDKLIIVVPCYNEEDVLEETIGQLSSIISDLIVSDRVSSSSCILFVDDGSMDKTWELIETAHIDNSFVCGLKLAHNSGHQNALMAGMEAAISAGADLIVTIDADLQDDSRIIPQMVQSSAEGFDIVFGVRKERAKDSWFKRNSAQLFYQMMRVLGVKLVYNHADFRLMRSSAVTRLLHYRERNLFLRGLVPCISDNSTIVYYDRGERKAGESKYPLRKMIHFATEGVTSFTVKPVKALLWLGAGFLLIAMAILVYVLFNYFKGDVVGGWASLMLSLWFIGGCILLGLGVIGEYIGKIYLEVKDRPRFFVEKSLL